MSNGVPLPPIGPVLLPPNPHAQAIEDAAERIQRHLLVVQALEYIKCRKAGGSMEECLFGTFRITPPKPDDPYFRELLDAMDKREAIELLQASKQHLSEQVELVTAKMNALEGK